MRHLRLQYLLFYLTTGAIFPYIAVFLRQEKGFTQEQIGISLAASSAVALLTPFLITLLADLQIDARRIAAGLFGVSIVSLNVIRIAEEPWVLILFWALHSVSFSPLIPLQDGMLFSLSKRREERGELPIQYHRIRVWGTVGFMIPSFGIFVAIRMGAPLETILVVAPVSAFLALMNTFLLSDARRGPEERAEGSRIPSAKDFKVLLNPKVLPFGIGMMLGHLGSAVFYAFFPVYLNETVGIAPEWIGLIFNVGVFFEVFFMLSYGWFVEKIGFRGVLTLGLLSNAIRIGALALFPDLATALTTQLLHGMTIIGLLVVPPMFLNQIAKEENRNSIQGLYHMLFYGGVRICGSLLAGQLAEIDLVLCFAVGSVCSLAGAIVVFCFFRPKAARELMETGNADDQ